ncbi:LATE EMBRYOGENESIS ABUNDANT PROTEIN 6-RELATED [Salix purpurea]|uniref:LATE EMBRYOGENESIS ABUNDANT PROTEIN 6-RELATED n=1 Tax=Salix purpurea TaxID=77065 RepID=A0A9Q0QG77_SALPP|nr:LATE EMBRYOGENESIS ABUNDANT PROTEIN 6-RELATED [Salix purpurea]
MGLRSIVRRKKVHHFEKKQGLLLILFASAVKERVAICKARVEEQAEFATARTAGEKELGKEHRKVKEAQTKMELHQAKARHAAEKLSYSRRRRRSHVVGTRPIVGTHANQLVGTAGTMPGSTVPTSTLGGHPPRQNCV